MKHVLITAETPVLPPETLAPQAVLSFLRACENNLGLDTHCRRAIAYSMSQENTGWTGFVFCPKGQMSFHHWDSADPAILQIDVMCSGEINLERVLAIVDRSWKGSPTRVIEFDRVSGEPIVRYGSDEVALAVRSGTGPSGHHHLLVAGYPTFDIQGTTAAQLDVFMRNLVTHIGMKCLTGIETILQPSRFIGAMVGISTSHVSLRVSPSENSLLIDVFSCRDLDHASLIDWLSNQPITVRPSSVVVCERYPTLSTSRFL